MASKKARLVVLCTARKNDSVTVRSSLYRVRMFCSEFALDPCFYMNDLKVKE